MKIRRSASGIFTRVFYDDGTDEIVPTRASQEFIEKFFQDKAEDFNNKFGRYPTSDDPFVFDPSEETPIELSGAKLDSWVLDMLDEKGVSPCDKYAFQITGHLVNVETKPMMTPEEIIRWFAAVSAWEQDTKLEAFPLDGVSEEQRELFEKIKKQHYLIVDKITEFDPDNHISKMIANTLLAATALNFKMFTDAGYLLCESADFIKYCVPMSEQKVVWREFLSLILLLAFQHIQQGHFSDPDQMDLGMAMADVFNADGDLVTVVNRFELSSSGGEDSISAFGKVIDDLMEDPFAALGVCVGVFGSLIHNEKLSGALSFEILHLPSQKNFHQLENLLEELEDDKISLREFGEKVADIFSFSSVEDLFDPIDQLEGLEELEDFDDDLGCDHDDNS